MRRLAMLPILFALPIAAQTLNTIYTFTGSPNDGAGPYSGLTIGAGGVLYGVTPSGGSASVGTAFSLEPPASTGGAWTETVLYNFRGGSNSGPLASLAEYRRVLYGTRRAGGLKQQGAVFALLPPTSPGGPWTDRLLYSFAGGNDGALPYGPVIEAGGVLYGVTYAGGASNVGTVFSLAPPSSPGASLTETVLYAFVGGPVDGGNPQGGLLTSSTGVLYGTTSLGGASNNGTVFSLTPPASPGGPWTEAVLYSFKGGSDGSVPVASLVMGSRGVLLGTTFEGGNSNHGTVFSLTPPASPAGSWTEAVLHAFASGTDGANPQAGVVIGSGGVLYGTTGGGGTPGFDGTVFSLTPPSSRGGSWTEKILHAFVPDSNGCYPAGGLVIDSSGVLYGTTAFCGNYSNDCKDGGCGTVFSLTP